MVANTLRNLIYDIYKSSQIKSMFIMNCNTWCRGKNSDLEIIYPFASTHTLAIDSRACRPSVSLSLSGQYMHILRSKNSRFHIHKLLHSKSTDIKGNFLQAYLKQDFKVSYNYIRGRKAGFL